MKPDYDFFSVKKGGEMDPIEILKWSINRFHPRIAIASSFNVEDAVVIDMATQIEPQIKVFYINTGFQFNETDDIKEVLRKKYNLNIVEYASSLSIKEQDHIHGSELYERDPDLCCKLRKVEPFKRALQELDAWITGLRRQSAITRKDIKVLELEYNENGRPLTKINPLAHWTRQQVWHYIVNNEISYNTLYEKGYMSIGCEPCTRPVLPGENDRAGRWVGKGKIECGIHTLMKKPK